MEPIDAASKAQINMARGTVMADPLEQDTNAIIHQTLEELSEQDMQAVYGGTSRGLGIDEISEIGMSSRYWDAIGEIQHLERPGIPSVPGAMKGPSLRDKMAVHYEKYKQPYQKAAAASVTGAVGGVLTAEGVHK